jgi:DNA-binding transcriptional MerR regulator
MVDKSPDAFRTISEVADDLDLPQHVLRFWETRFGQIRPLKRGGGRRYYRPDDVDLLRGIRALLYGQGYTIRGVQRILKEKGIRYVQALGRGEQVAPLPGPTELEQNMPSPGLSVDAGAFGSREGEDAFGPAQAGFADDASRPASPGQGFPSHGFPGHGLPTDVVLRLNGVLAELMECRRLLASTRGSAMADPDGA